jgi:hypothetical protein
MEPGQENESRKGQATEPSSTEPSSSNGKKIGMGIGNLTWYIGEAGSAGGGLPSLLHGLELEVGSPLKPCNAERSQRKYAVHTAEAPWKCNEIRSTFEL